MWECWALGMAILVGGAYVFDVVAGWLMDNL